MTFNPNELCTDQQARDLRGFINFYPWPVGILKDNGERVGGGVKPGDGFTTPATMDTAGIFLPSWTAGPNGDPEPNGTDPVTGEPTYWLSVRFENGMTSNVGLMRRALYVTNTTAGARYNQMAYWMTYFGA